MDRFEELVNAYGVASERVGFYDDIPTQHRGELYDDAARERDTARAALLEAIRELETRYRDAEHAAVAWATGDFGELMEDDE